MNRSLIILISFLFVGFLIPQKVYASVKAPSATLASKLKPRQDVLDMRIKALRGILNKYNSPITDQAFAFVKYADEYGVDWKLLPSIAGLESTFGKFLIPGSYNAYGWGGGRIYFESWEDGIQTINKALRERYMDRGADTVWSIGPIYAESPTWSVRVNQFMTEVEEEYRKLFLLSMTSTI